MSSSQASNDSQQDQDPSQTSQTSDGAQQNQDSTPKQASFKLPTVFRTKARVQALSEKDQEGIATLGIQEVLRSDFDSSGTFSEASMSSVEAKRGFDLSWYKRNHFSLYVDIKMDPIDIFASGDDFIFAQDVIEANIQQSFESEMSKIAILNRCFVTLKATSSRQAEKFLNIPLKVAMRVEGRGTAKEITLEACPPQSDSANAPTKETMKTEMLKLQAKFPVVYRESYKRKDTIPRFWCCSLHEHNPFDEVICLSIDFQIHFNEEKVHKNQLIAWEIIHKWMKDNHNFDMDDESKYEQKLVASRQFTAQIAHRVTQPRFYISFTADSMEELSSMCYVLGMLHGRTIRLTAKEAPSCNHGFDFRFYCTLFDPSIKAARPNSLKPTIEKVLQDITPKTDSNSMLKSFMLSHNPPKGTPLTIDWLKSHPDLSILSDIEKLVSNLIEEGVLKTHPVHPNILTFTAKHKPWNELKLHFQDQSVATIQHKDNGIWIDSSFGLPHEQKVMNYKCFSIHVALAYSAISRSELSAWHLEEYMQYRYNHFRTLLHHLQANPAAMRLFVKQHESMLRQGNNSQIDPDHIANPAFWSSLFRLG